MLGLHRQRRAIHRGHSLPTLSRGKKDRQHSRHGVDGTKNHEVFPDASQYQGLPGTHHRRTMSSTKVQLHLREQVFYSLHNTSNLHCSSIAKSIAHFPDSTSEMEVLMSAVRWLMHDWETRKQYMLDVLKCIRFGLIAPWQLVDVKRNPENPEFMELMSYPEVQKMVDDGLA